jgi:hypothetical protein
MAAELLPSSTDITTGDPTDMLFSSPNVMPQQTQDDNPELTERAMATAFNDGSSTASMSSSSIPGQPSTTPDNAFNLNQTQNPFSLPDNSPVSTPLLWRTWITAESIRRIYLAATFMQSVYRTLKQGWSACPGGAAFTALSGLWDARIGFEWVGILQQTGTSTCHSIVGEDEDRRGEGRNVETEKKGGLVLLSPWVMVQSLEAWRILREGKWDEVDEFTKGVLEISYGVERVEGWRYGSC